MILLAYIALGILLNFVGPLADHLILEKKYFLKKNKDTSVFFKLTFLVVARSFAMIIYPVFYFNYYILKRKPIRPNYLEERLNASIVKKFRTLGHYNNTAPTEKISDEKIIEIFGLVGSAFRKASTLKNERIHPRSINTIAMKFFKLYEILGEDFIQEHLEYEVKKYLEEGLRPEYRNGISFF